jgi:hypothetical protein
MKTSEYVPRLLRERRVFFKGPDDHPKTGQLCH